jgi:hypothetical protein
VGLGPFFITNPVRRIVSFRRKKGFTLSSSTVLTSTSRDVGRELGLSPPFVSLRVALLAHGFNGFSHDERRESLILLTVGDFFVRLGLGGVIPLVESDSSGIARSCGGCFSGDTTATASAACLDAASDAASASADSIWP